MGGRRGQRGSFGEGSGHHRLGGEAKGGENLSLKVAEVGEPQTCRVGGPQNGRGDGGNRGDPRRSGCPEKGGAENPRGDGDALRREDKLGHVVHGIVVHLLLNLRLLLLLSLLVLSGRRSRTACAHGIAVLRNRVAAGCLHVGGGDGRSDDGRILPEGGRTECCGGGREGGRERGRERERERERVEP